MNLRRDKQHQRDQSMVTQWISAIAGSISCVITLIHLLVFALPSQGEFRATHQNIAMHSQPIDTTDRTVARQLTCLQRQIDVLQAKYESIDRRLHELYVHLIWEQDGSKAADKNEREIQSEVLAPRTTIGDTTSNSEQSVLGEVPSCL